MKKLFPFFAFAILMGIVLGVPSSCYYDNEEDLYGGIDGCDTVSMRYSAEIRSILQNNCYSCHSVASNVAGSPFETYATLRPYVDNGLLVSYINNTSDPMPPTGLMPDCDRQKIEAWVKAGAPDN